MPNYNNDIHQAIYEQVVEPALAEKRDMIKGFIISYDHTVNLAVVKIPSPFTKGTFHTLSEVPVNIQGGLSTSGPFPGDEVWIQYVGGNAHMPRIISLADEDYNYKTRPSRLRHTKMGAFVPDMICARPMQLKLNG